MEFRILGPLEVLDAQGRRLALGGPKQRALLAVLLLHAGQVVAVERLVDELWGEDPPEGAAHIRRSRWPTCARCWNRSGLGERPVRCCISSRPATGSTPAPTGWT